MCRYHNLFIYLSITRHLGRFHLLAIGNNAAVTVGVQVSVQIPAFDSFGTYPEVELLDQDKFGLMEESSFNDSVPKKVKVTPGQKVPCEEQLNGHSLILLFLF